jgi:hypothetical protein
VFSKKNIFVSFFPTTVSSSLIISACSRPMAGVEDALLLPHLRQCTVMLEAPADAKAHLATECAVLLASLTCIYLFSSLLFSALLYSHKSSSRIAKRARGNRHPGRPPQANYRLVERGRGFLRCVRSGVEEFIGLPRCDLPA